MSASLIMFTYNSELYVNTSKLLVASAAVRSKVVILMLFIHCLLLLTLCVGFLCDPLFCDVVLKC